MIDDDPIDRLRRHRHALYLAWVRALTPLVVAVLVFAAAMLGK